MRENDREIEKVEYKRNVRRNGSGNRPRTKELQGKRLQILNTMKTKEGLQSKIRMRLDGNWWNEI